MKRLRAASALVIAFFCFGSLAVWAQTAASTEGPRCDAPTPESLKSDTSAWKQPGHENVICIPNLQTNSNDMLKVQTTQDGLVFYGWQADGGNAHQGGKWILIGPPGFPIHVDEILARHKDVFVKKLVSYLSHPGGLLGTSYDDMVERIVNLQSKVMNAAYKKSEKGTPDPRFKRMHADLNEQLKNQAAEPPSTQAGAPQNPTGSGQH